MIALSIPLTVVDGLNMSWTLPKVLLMCRMVKVFPCVAVFMSSLTIVAIACDRYRVIVSPDRLQVGGGQAWACLPAILLVSCLLSSPLFFRTKLFSLATFLVGHICLLYTIYNTLPRPPRYCSIYKYKQCPSSNSVCYLVTPRTQNIIMTKNLHFIHVSVEEHIDYGILQNRHITSRTGTHQLLITIIKNMQFER